MFADQPIPLRAAPEEIARRLDELDGAGRKGLFANVRQARRISYRVPAVQILLAEPNGTRRTFLAPTRNISQHGLAALFGRFVHPGTTCAVRLVAGGALDPPVEARVVYCRYIRGTPGLHQLGLRFVHAVDVTRFNRAAGRINLLCADARKEAPAELETLLREFDIQITHAATADDAVAAAVFDDNLHVVLLNLDQPALSPNTLIAALKVAGYRGIVIGVTRQSRGVNAPAYEAGCTLVLRAPLTSERLSFALRTGLQTSLTPTPPESRIEKVIEAFVDLLPSRLAQLEAALEQRDLRLLEYTAGLMGTQAATLGYSMLARAAGALARSVKAGGPLAQLREQLDELADLRLTAKGPEDQP